MTTVYLHGHGSWTPSMGYTKVPANCSLTFYTHFAKLLNATMVKQIMAGTYTKTESEHGAFKTVPNLQISSLTQGQVNNAYTWGGGVSPYILHTLPVAPKTRLSLSDVMADCTAAYGKKLDFHWLCCQSLGLSKVGGREFGLNASDRTAQSGHNGQYLFKWKDVNGIQQQKWVKSNNSMHQ